MARTPAADDPALPEPDRAEGAPHPREAAHVFGQEAAEAAFLAARAGGRLHHAWLLTGPRGVGKATLAWRLARFLLCAPDSGQEGLFGAPPPPASADIAPDHPVARRIRALSEPRLFLMRRGPSERGNALSQVIRVDEVRALRRFLGLRAADGGQRVVILDSADDLNPNAANALLKLLEEPPPEVTFLMVAHQPARLLPTIRSRCRRLALAPLGPQAIAAALEQAGVAPPADPAALAELAGGSAGAALRLAAQGGLALYADLAGLMAQAPGIDRPRLMALAEGAGRAGGAGFDLAVDLLDALLARAARAGATGLPPAAEAAPGEAALLARLAPDARAARAWAEAAQVLGARARAGRAVNLDPAALLADMLIRLDETAGRLAAG